MNLLKKTIYGILLTALLSSSLMADCSYQLFSINSTKNTKIMDFVNYLSDECEFSVLVNDKETQQYLQRTLNKTHLKDLTIDEVLKIILEGNNLSYTLKNNVLKISYLTTKVFSVDYILSQRKSIGSTNITLSSAASGDSGSSSGATGQTGMSIDTTDEVRFWHELDVELQSILNRPSDSYIAEKPIVNKNAGLITVTATIKQLNRFQKYLNNLQKKVQLQVLIDVQLLSVTMSAAKTTGIDWKQLYALQSVSLSAGYSNTNGQGTRNYAIQAGGSLNEIIKFLKTQGDVISISNPKVLTLNNQPALITAGTEYFYKITSTQTLASGTSGTQSQNEDVKSVFAGVLLDITPEISDDKTITLKINPSLSETTEDLSAAQTSDRTMPPDLTRRQLSSVVTVKDGNRIILGGLISTRTVHDVSKIPILGDIPLLNYLFKYESNTKQVQELVIIIQPHIVDKSKRGLSLSDLGFSELSESNSTKVKK